MQPSDGILIEKSVLKYFLYLDESNFQLRTRECILRRRSSTYVAFIMTLGVNKSFDLDDVLEINFLNCQM